MPLLPRAAGDLGVHRGTVVWSLEGFRFVITTIGFLPLRSIGPDPLAVLYGRLVRVLSVRNPCCMTSRPASHQYMTFHG